MLTVPSSNLRYCMDMNRSRVMPEGTGRVNEKGLDFYRRLVDALGEAGIEPNATLFHWDLPAALEDRGGWQNRDVDGPADASYRCLRDGPPEHGREAGFKGKLGCHVFRATGITAYLEAGGTLENAQAMAAHESPRTTKLYDRTGDEITLDEVERITI